MTPSPTPHRALSLKGLIVSLALMIQAATGAIAQDNPFAPGWVLQAESSAINFQSVKNQTKVESSSFVTFSGGIDANGLAELKVLLDSVDTKIDLRNVRMRFLFFETFQFPEAKINLQLAPAMIADLPEKRRKLVTVPYTMQLHGVTKDFTAELAITLVTGDLVAVSTSTPISVAVADFALGGGIQKLQEAAGVEIIPSATVTFDLLFARQGAGAGAVTAAAQPEPEKPASAALEAAGDFDIEACVGRFEILSRSGNIYFGSGSARLAAKSAPLLDSLVDIVARCPGLVIEVSGHTDSDGSETTNMRLSESRAKSVAGYLANKGIEPARIVTIGMGEAKPVAANDSAANKARNRRIEFAVVGR